MALDLGTTHLEASLIDLISGRTMARSTRENPQTEHGADILARIHFATDRNGKKGDGLAVLHKQVIGCINSLAETLSRQADLTSADIRALAVAGNTASYIESQTRFSEISNPQQQAETWAVCAAAYDVMSTIMLDSAPERSRQLHNLANGAQVSIGMALVAAQLGAATDTARFGELWAASESAMVDLPQQKLADILEDGEAMGNEGAADFGKKINATVLTCIDNLDTQRDYVESWQRLAEKGLVEPPED